MTSPTASTAWTLLPPTTADRIPFSSYAASPRGNQTVVLATFDQVVQLTDRNARVDPNDCPHPYRAARESSTVELRCTSIFLGSLHWEMLGSGVKKTDGSIIACMLSGVFVYKNGSCQAYTKPFGEWRAEPGARCTLQGATFRVTDPYGVKGELTLVGDGKLVPDPGKALFATKVKDWSEAKAKVQKKWAAPPPPR